MNTEDAIYRHSGEEDIFSYARHNRLAHLRRCLDSGYDVESRDYAGNTVLMVGAQNGLKNVIKCALRRGAQLDTQNDMGNTALHFCFAFGFGDTLGAYLIQKGADDTLTSLHQPSRWWWCLPQHSCHSTL